MPELVYFNGEVTDFTSARVSIDDRGYQFGDGIYEVIRAYQGKLFALHQHLERLFRSAKEVYIPLPYQPAELEQLLLDIYRQSALSEAMMYIQITRGTLPRKHIFPLDLKPNLLVTIRHLPDLPSSLWDDGISVITVPDGRWDKCHIKTISLIANILAKHQAREAGADEAIFVRNNGIVTEAASSNVFAVIDGTIFTHPADHHILAGITRQYVLDIAREQNLAVREDFFTIDDLRCAEEVFITSSIQEIVPVVRIDNRAVADGRPGKVTRKLLAYYRKRVAAELS
ncbi:MAG: D-amino-acid transaminase [Firmicutes bacterium]|nr:D-amino-acid transaminase [Bacillota bacterium]